MYQTAAKRDAAQEKEDLASVSTTPLPIESVASLRATSGVSSGPGDASAKSASSSVSSAPAAAAVSMADRVNALIAELHLSAPLTPEKMSAVARGPRRALLSLISMSYKERFVNTMKQELVNSSAWRDNWVIVAGDCAYGPFASREAALDAAYDHEAHDAIGAFYCTRVGHDDTSLKVPPSEQSLVLDMPIWG